MSKKVTDLSAFEAIQLELAAADVKYSPMSSALDGLHTIKCELAELEKEVMLSAITREVRTDELIKEAIQVAAMGIKFLRDVCGMDISGPTFTPELDRLGKAPDPTEEAPSVSLRGLDWLEFSAKVLDHIEVYTVPQYGDKGEDVATDYTMEVIAGNIGRYQARMGSNSRPGEEHRDLIKIAHYASLAYFLDQ